MIKYLIVHNKHEGCYDFQYYEDHETKMRLTSITINPPKIYVFNNRDSAQEFFEDYIYDVDNTDPRCKKGDDIEHVTYCTCGVIELDEDENPILFYNKKNQIFLLENGPQIFSTPNELTNDIKNFNLTNKLIRRFKTLSKEQKERYVELGKFCLECTSLGDEKKTEKDTNANSDGQEEINQSKPPKENPFEPISVPVPLPDIPIPIASATTTTTTTTKEKKLKEKKIPKKKAKEQTPTPTPVPA